MALPQDALDAIFPTADGPLFGFALGTALADLAKNLPNWFKPAPTTPNGHTYGWTGSLCVSFEFSVERLRRATGKIDLADEDDLELGFRELADAFDKKYGTGTRRKKKKKNLGEWSVPGDVPATLRLEAEPYYMGREIDEYLLRLEISVEPAAGVEIKPLSDSPRWIDVDALAKPVATNAWPAETVAKVYREFFAYDDGARYGQELWIARADQAASFSD